MDLVYFAEYAQIISTMNDVIYICDRGNSGSSSSAISSLRGKRQRLSETYNYIEYYSVGDRFGVIRKSRKALMEFLNGSEQKQGNSCFQGIYFFLNVCEHFLMYLLNIMGILAWYSYPFPAQNETKNMITTAGMRFTGFLVRNSAHQWTVCACNITRMLSRPL